MTTRMRECRKGPNDRKLADLILRISKLSEGDYHFGAVELKKLLFFSDLAAFVSLGRSITGQVYVKQPLGPAPRRIGKVIDGMTHRKELAVSEKQVLGGHTQRRTFALVDPDLNARFNASEVAIVDDVVSMFKDCKASDVSGLSHELDGWKLAKMNEEIPLSSALSVAPSYLTKAEQAHAAKLGPIAKRLLAA